MELMKIHIQASVLQETRSKGEYMTFTAWSHEGEWYGFRISKTERDSCFSRELQTVILELPHGNGTVRIQVNVSPSFWKNCPELRSSKIRNWFNECGYSAPTTIKVPRFQAEFVNQNTIRIARNAE